MDWKKHAALKIEILHTLAIQKYIALFEITMTSVLYTNIVTKDQAKI